MLKFWSINYARVNEALLKLDLVLVSYCKCVMNTFIQCQ